jgi:tetratricopeptide (TPR) repeat protein
MRVDNQRRAKGDYLAAICNFDEVLQAKPAFVWCYYERAGAYSLMGNQQAALADLDRAIVAMPGEPKAWRA